MSVLVDTPVWSELLRRRIASRPADDGVRIALRLLVEDGDAMMIGPIRQELLSGIKDVGQVERLRLALRAFSDEPLESADYETAADFFNRCRSAGVQGSNTDFLICAASVRRSAPVFTLDRDFELFARVVPIQLYRP